MPTKKKPIRFVNLLVQVMWLMQWEWLISQLKPSKPQIYRQYSQARSLWRRRSPSPRQLHPKTATLPSNLPETANKWRRSSQRARKMPWNWCWKGPNAVRVILWRHHRRGTYLLLLERKSYLPIILTNKWNFSWIYHSF